METILPTHPERSLILLQRSLMLYAASFVRVILLALVISLIVFLPRLISDIIGRDLLLNIRLVSFTTLWIWVLNFISLTFFIAMIWRMHCIEQDKHEPLSEDFRVAIRKLPYVIVAAFIQMIIVFAISAITVGIQYLLHKYNLLFGQSNTSIVITLITFIGQFFLLLFVSTLFIFYLPLITIENKGVFAALKKSLSLSWRHWWRILFLQLIPWMVYLVVLITFRNIFEINVTIYFAKNVQHPIWVTCLQLILFAFFIIWAAALLLVQLKDLELRKNLISKSQHAAKV